jgi:hypothetical protein
MQTVPLRISTACLAALLCPCMFAGCAPLIYAYPKVHHFAVRDVNAATGDVRAFQQKTSRSGFDLLETQDVSLAPVRLADDVHKVSHTEITLKSYAGIVSALSHGWWTDHSVALRLYRPGYHLVVIEPGQEIERVHWTPAPTLAEQERAVDIFLSLDRPPPRTLTSLHGSSSCPEWGPPLDVPSFPIVDEKPLLPFLESRRSRREREVLRFAAGEYSRLAGILESQEHAPIRQTGLDPNAVRKAAGAPEERQESLRRLRAKVAWLDSQIE